MDLSNLDVEYHVNGVVTTRRYLKSNEDTVRRFLRAYIEGAVRGAKDKAFAMKTMGKYFRTDDRELLEETYEMSIKTGFTVPPYPAGVASLLQEVEKHRRRRKARNRKISLIPDWCASSIRADSSSPCSRGGEVPRKTAVTGA